MKTGDDVYGVWISSNMSMTIREFKVLLCDEKTAYCINWNAEHSEVYPLEKDKLFTELRQAKEFKESIAMEIKVRARNPSLFRYKGDEGFKNM